MSLKWGLLEVRMHDYVGPSQAVDFDLVEGPKRSENFVRPIADYFSFLIVSFSSASIVTSTDAPSLIVTSSPFSSLRVFLTRISR